MIGMLRPSSMALWLFFGIFRRFFHGYVENRCQYRGSVLCQLIYLRVFVFRPSPEPRSSRLGIILGRNIPRLNPRALVGVSHEWGELPDDAGSCRIIMIANCLGTWELILSDESPENYCLKSAVLSEVWINCHDYLLSVVIKYALSGSPF